MSFIAAKKNFKLQRGATWHNWVIWKSGTPATPVNLTGRFARMEIRKREGAPLKCEVICDITDPTSGRIDLWIHVPATLLIEKGVYSYDLEVVLPNAYTVNGEHYDDVVRLLQGNIQVLENVTSP